MGIIRGGLLVVVSVFLFITLLAGFLLLTVSWSLNYENVKVELGAVLQDQANENIDLDFLGENYEAMQTYCDNYDNYVINYENIEVVVPCSVILNGSDSIITYSIDRFVEKIYFAHYDCSFVNCFAEYEVPFFIISAKAQKYFYSLFNTVLILFGIFAIIGFLLSEKKSNFFLLIAVLIAIAALPFSQFDIIVGDVGSVAKGLLHVFFSKAYTVFIYGIILGAALLLIGLILKLFKVGFKIQTIFQKDETAKPKEKPEEKVDKDRDKSKKEKQKPQTKKESKSDKKPKSKKK